VKSEYLKREINAEDRRKSNLVVTEEGKFIIQSVQHLVLENRKNALETIATEQLTTMNNVLKKIIKNCS
jgi:MarR family transcriptional regulator for hemolysin